MNALVNWFAKDADEQSQTLVGLTLIVIALCPIWYGTYLAVGAPAAAVPPVAYQAMSLANLLVYRKKRNFGAFRLVQCGLILLLPLGVHVVLGGFTGSSGVLLWSSLAPVIALVFGSDKLTLRCFFAFAVVVVAGALQQSLAPFHAQPLPVWLQRSFFGLNLSVPAIITLFTVRYYARQVQTERAEQLRLNGKLSSLIGQMTEQQQQLELASEHKSQFLRHMSHELRTPLNAIIGYGELLDEELQEIGQDDLARDARQILAASRHLLTLINQVLDLSKVEAGKLELVLDTFSIAELVDDVAAVARPLMAAKDNEFVVTRDDAIDAMRTDRLRLKQAIVNLLSNAAKFTEGGTVSLSVEHRGDGDVGIIAFVVRDTGVGITEEQMGRLFQDFSQATSDAAHKYGGTGLGLSLSRRLCRLMGGDITVDSTPGEGSTFTITVPRGMVQGASTAGASGRPTYVPSTEIATGSPSRHILLLSADAVKTLSLSRVLSGEGFHVSLGTDPQSCRSVAKQATPEAIVACVDKEDHGMWSLLAALADETALADVPVVVLRADLADTARPLGDGLLLGQVSVMGRLPKTTNLMDALAHLGEQGELDRDGAVRPVLIVDDDEQTRQLLGRRLEQQGYAWDEAEHGQAALERLEEQVPSAIVLDLVMPVMDGFTFLTKLREHPRWRSIPVFVLSGKELSADQRTRTRGAEAVFRKGDDGSVALVRTIRDILGTPRRSDEGQGSARRGQ